MNYKPSVYSLSWLAFCQLQSELTSELFDLLVYNHNKNLPTTDATLNEFLKKVIQKVYCITIANKNGSLQDFYAVFWFTWLLLSFYGYLIVSNDYNEINFFEILNNLKKYYATQGLEGFKKTFVHILIYYPQIYDVNIIQYLWNSLEPLFNGTVVTSYQIGKIYCYYYY